MADVKVTPAKVETKVVEVEPAKVSVDLTMDEASALYALVSRTQSEGPLSELFRAMASQGIDRRKYRVMVEDKRTGSNVLRSQINVLERITDAFTSKYGDDRW